MKRIVTPAEMREIDRKTIEERGVAGKILMDRAGRAVFQTIQEHPRPIADLDVVVMCGKGNNGGDGLVVAHALAEVRSKPKVFILCRREEMKTDLRMLSDSLLAESIEPVFVHDDSVQWPSQVPDIVVDALLGTGSVGPPSGLYQQAIHKINSWRGEGAHVISVDIPSGLNGETGLVSDIAVKADTTVTMGLPKTGLIFGDGRAFIGELKIADLGFPEDLLAGGDTRYVEDEDVQQLLPFRKHDAHKYDFGKVLFIGGSKGMSGASFLTSAAALRAGCGVLKAAIPRSIAHVIETSLPEAMILATEETPDGTISSACLDKLCEWCLWADVVAVGPGLSRGSDSSILVEGLLARINRPLVLDADALAVLCQKADLVAQYKQPVVMTPHMGELAMMLGLPKEKAKQDSAGLLLSYAKATGKIVLLKGSPTRVAAADGRIFIVNRGNPGMATAGSGDVLTGIIAGLLAQGVAPLEAAYGGAYLHGCAGDRAAAELGQHSVLAGDILRMLPCVIRSITNKRG